MYKFFTLFVILDLSLYAATPELFKPIGDPVYHEVPSVKKMAKMDYFTAQGQIFQDFIHEARFYQELGFAYDKKEGNKSLSKTEQKNYINGLRDLQKQLDKINFIAKTALEEIIKKEKIAPFYELKDTDMSVLKSDKNIAQSITQYEKRVVEIRRSQEQQRIRDIKSAKEQEYRMLRSFENLDGNWKDDTDQGQTVVAHFNKNRLTLTYSQKNESHILNGSYTIEKSLDFHIDTRELIKEKVSHVRTLNLSRVFEIQALSPREIILQYKDETLRLKRFKP